MNNAQDIKMYEEYAESVFTDKEYGEAAARYEELCRQLGDRGKIKYFQRMVAAYRNAGRAEEIPDALKRTSSAEAKEAEKSYQLVKVGSVDKAYEVFSSLINNIFSEKQVANIWIDGYSFICGLFNEDFNPEVNNITSSQIDHYKPIKKVIASGMGWSGSGAIYDYFKEFTEVTPFELKYEFGLIESKPSLLAIKNSAVSFKQFRNVLLDFFGVALLGFADYDSYPKWKRGRVARIMSLSQKKLEYAIIVRHFLKGMSDVWSGKIFNEKLFRKAATNLVDEIAMLFSRKENHIILLDNVIHIYNVEAIELLDEALLLCVFRDPRSNFVARKNEDPKFDSNVESYINNYKMQRKKFDQALNSLQHNKDKVHVIQFEDFVLDEEYRTNLAVKIGLDLSTQSKFKYFKPWESKKNFFLHESYEKQDEIKAIEDALPEYCIDVQKLKDEKQT